MEMLEKIVGFLEDRKAENIVKINLEGKTSIADYFVICSVRTATQVIAVSNHLLEDMENIGVNAIRTEGIKEGKWAVIDFGDVIVHVFSDENREFYRLEKLWEGTEN